MDKKENFEAWAMIELFGHNRISGLVSEQNIGGASFVRVDVPETTQQPAFTRTFNPSAVYAFNWCDEQTARNFAESFQQKPVMVYDIRAAAEKMILAAKGEEE